ncbi:hypothetical protein BDV06DRAFT_218256 [Aspergillus oleicola]
MRAKGGVIASASNWLFAVFNASFLPMVYLYPEVRGLSLEQIDHIFESQRYGWSCFTQGVRESVKDVEAIEARRATAGLDIEDEPSTF